MNELLYEFDIVTPKSVTINDIVKYMETDSRWSECIKSPYDSDKRIPITQYSGPYGPYTNDISIQPIHYVGFFKEIIDNKLVIYTSEDLWLSGLLHKLFDDGVKLYAYPRMLCTIDDKNNTTIKRLISFDISLKDEYERKYSNFLNR